MAQIVPLKCPSCGAPLNHDSSRCDFCGTELLLIQNGSGFQTKTAYSCLRCGNLLGNGAWLCPKCGTPVPGNEDRLRELQMKQRYLQNELKKNVPQLATVLEPDGFIEYCPWEPQGMESGLGYEDETGRKEEMMPQSSTR